MEFTAPSFDPSNVPQFTIPPMDPSYVSQFVGPQYPDPSYVMLKPILSQFDLSGSKAYHVYTEKNHSTEFYEGELGIPMSNVIWMEGNIDLVNYLKAKPEYEGATILHGIVSDVDEFEHDVFYTVDSFFSENNLDASDCHVWYIGKLCPSGMVLRGASKSIPYANLIFVSLYYMNGNICNNDFTLSELDEFMTNAGLSRVDTNTKYALYSRSSAIITV
jgi:hypothetical protein